MSIGTPLFRFTEMEKSLPMLQQIQTFQISKAFFWPVSRLFTLFLNRISRASLLCVVAKGYQVSVLKELLSHSNFNSILMTAKIHEDLHNIQHFFSHLYFSVKHLLFMWMYPTQLSKYNKYFSVKKIMMLYLSCMHYICSTSFL